MFSMYLYPHCDIQLQYVGDFNTQLNSTHGSTSTHEPHVTYCQGEALGALVSDGSTATQDQEAKT